MIEYIHTQLSLWGKSQMDGARKSLGFSSECPMFKGVRYGGGYASRPPIGVTLTAREDIDDTDRAVSRLDAPMRKLVVEFYVIGGKGEEVARRLGIKRQRLYDRLHALHAVMLGLIQDVVVERMGGETVDRRRTVSV